MKKWGESYACDWIFTGVIQALSQLWVFDSPCLIEEIRAQVRWLTLIKIQWRSLVCFYLVNFVWVTYDPEWYDSVNMKFYCMGFGGVQSRQMGYLVFIITVVCSLVTSISTIIKRTLKEMIMWWENWQLSQTPQMEVLCFEAKQPFMG